jgi:hypothetical protein
MNYIKEMFALQMQLNDKTNGPSWKEKGITKEGVEISWYRCIYMETCEAIDSLNWKHWKNINQEPDWDNIKVELVDIWHFIMSQAIYLGNTNNFNKDIFKNYKKEFNPKSLLKNLELMLFISVKANIDKDKNYIDKIIDIFFQSLANANMELLDLYKSYVVKNQLNIFRQANGYKDGSYIKIWNNLEDNVIAFNIIEKNPDLTPKQFYKKLEEKYTSIKKS